MDFTNEYTALGNTLYDDLLENLFESFEWAGENDSDSLGGYAVWAPEVIWNKDFINEDGNGQDAVFPESFYQKEGNFLGNVDHMNIGNKILGNFYFERQSEESGSEFGYGYLSPGHNSVYQDSETNQLFIVFHTRFPDKREDHELRIHQMFINEND